MGFPIPARTGVFTASFEASESADAEEDTPGDEPLFCKRHFFLYSALLYALSASLNPLPPQKDAIQLNFVPICYSRDAKLYISMHILPQCCSAMSIRKIAQDIETEISETELGLKTLPFCRQLQQAARTDAS